MAYSLRETREPAPAFDALDYVLYIRRRWRFTALACAVAFTLALSVSLFMPKRYTSTASIIIEPPAGTDPRTFTAISPVYLESLKTYEIFATSDTLFGRALDHFKLRDPNSPQPIETLKARVLKVTKLRDTKVLQISINLPNAVQAQAVAQFLADETVKLSSTVGRDTGRDIIDDAQRQADAARARLDEVQKLWSKTRTDEPTESMRAEIESMVELLYRLRRNGAEAEAYKSEYETKIFARQVQELDQALTAKTKLLAERSTRLDQLDNQRKNAQAIYDAASRRAQDMRASLGSSGERLKVIDPGIVPEKPSEPKIGLQVGIAVGLALLGSIVYLSFAFGFRT